MKSFVHKSKNFVINALFDGKPVKFIDEFCSDGIKLAFFENQSGWCTLDILKFFLQFLAYQPTNKLLQ